MLDALAKIGPVAASSAASLVAFLVYRVNADKLFLEMLGTRRGAAQEVLDAAQARDMEAISLPVTMGAEQAYALPEQARFWRALQAAEGLFGREVAAELKRLDLALTEKIGSILNLRMPKESIDDDRAALDRHSQAVAELEACRASFARAVLPYTELGRRGLPLLVRFRLRK